MADALAEAMLARLRDRQPAIRCQAALALARLADPGEVRTASRLEHGREEFWNDCITKVLEYKSMCFRHMLGLSTCCWLLVLGCMSF